MNLNKKIAIIIVNWKQYELTINCLLSLKKLEYKNWKVILVDNESNFEKINKIKSDFNKVEVIESKENLGFAKGANLGIKETKTDYVFINPADVFIPQKCIEELIECIILVLL